MPKEHCLPSWIVFLVMGLLILFLIATYMVGYINGRNDGAEEALGIKTRMDQSPQPWRDRFHDMMEKTK